jgi:hypothetical protein
LLPIGDVGDTVIPKLTVPDPPATRLPIEKVQILPELGAVQDHPEVLFVGLNTVLLGIISVMLVPVAVVLPTLE